MCIRDRNRNVLATVVDGDRMTDEGGEDGGAAAPGLEDVYKRQLRLMIS